MKEEIANCKSQLITLSGDVKLKKKMMAEMDTKLLDKEEMLKE